MSVKKILFTQAALVTAFLNLAACATLPEASTPMGLGQTAAAPTGYLDFCRRQPQDCSGAPAPVIQKVAEIELARRGASESRHVSAASPRQARGAPLAQPVNWTEAFAEAKRRREMAEQSTAALEAAVAAVSHETALNSTPDARSGLQRISYNRTAEAFSPTRAAPVLQTAAAPAAPAMTPALWSQITKVNDKVNRALGRRSDLEGYGVMDRWATPLSSGAGYGDCEDFVLEKRRALIAEGLPETSLSIAVATTSWGEHHAVLLVETDQGVYVLDSLTPWILPWRKANLRWHERQVAGAPFRWAMVDVSLSSNPLADLAPAPPVARDVPAKGPAKGEETDKDTLPAPTEAEVFTLALATGPFALRGRL